MSTEKAVSTGQSIVDRLKAMFNFTASPTINPRFNGPATLPAGASPSAAPSAPSAPAAAAPGKQSRLGGGTKVAGLTVIQNINGAGDPKAVARESQRQTNRAIRAAQARSLHDLGSATA